jgi:hypothetical protein
MPAMKKMSSSWKEEQVERGESTVVAEFSASSSIRISWSRQPALQNAFSPLQGRGYSKKKFSVSLPADAENKDFFVPNHARMNRKPICLDYHHYFILVTNYACYST